MARGRLFLSGAVFLIAFLTFQTTSVLANHERIDVFQERGRYVQGDSIWTDVEISTGIVTNHERVTGNETHYYIEVKDTLIDHPGAPPRVNTTGISVLNNDTETVRFQRPFVEGYWLIDVKVFGDDPNRPLKEWNDTIVVQPQTVLLIEQQAEAANRSAQLANQTLQATPVYVISAALGGAALGAGGTFGVHAWLDWRRENRENSRENEFRNSVRTLIRLELTAYHDFINRIIENNDTKGDRKEILVIRGDTELTALAKRILPLKDDKDNPKANPHNYLDLTPDTKARAFRPQQIRVLEDLYGELQNFGPRPSPPNEYEFNRDVITPLRDRIDSAITSLDNKDFQNFQSSSGSDEGLGTIPKSKEMLYQFKLSVFQVRVGLLFAIALSLLFLGWGGVISAWLTMGTLDPVNPPENAWPTLASVANYLLWIGIAGIIAMGGAAVFSILEGRALRKEANSFN